MHAAARLARRQGLSQYPTVRLVVGDLTCISVPSIIAATQVPPNSSLSQSATAATQRRVRTRMNDTQYAKFGRVYLGNAWVFRRSDDQLCLNFVERE